MRDRSSADSAFERFRRHGDARALARLFDATAPELLRIAQYLAGDRHRAEDLVQVTFLTVLEQRQDFVPGNAVMPWMLGILANRARALRKQEARTLDARRVPVPAIEEGPEEAALREERAATLRRVLQRLPSPYREVLVLHALHGLTAVEIETALGVPAATARKQIARGMERLRRLLPAGLASGVVVTVSRESLAAVREAVLAQLPAAAAATSAAVFLGGLTMGKTVAGAVVVVLASGAAWMWHAAGLQDATPGSLAEEHAREAVPAPKSVSSPTEAGSLPPSPEAHRVEPAALPDTPLLLVSTVRMQGGEPVAGIHVRAFPLEGFQELSERRCVTDAEGLAAVPGVTPGAWKVQADRGGDSRDVTLGAGTSQTVELRIPEGVRVRGTVLDEQRAPVPGARVWVAVEPGQENRGEVVAQTDAAGCFELLDVAPGRRVAAQAPGYVSSFCVAVEGTPGATQEVELMLVSGGITVRGSVVDEAGAPVVHAAVVGGWAALEEQGFADAEDTPLWPPGQRTWTDAEGRFELLGFRPELRVPFWACASGFTPTRETRMPAGPVQEIELVLQRGATLQGRVRDTDGQPVEGSIVQVSQQALATRTPLQSPSWAIPERHQTTGEDGTFCFTDLHPGTLEVGASRKFAVAFAEFEIRSGEEISWDAVLDVPPAVTGTLLEESGAPLAGWQVWARTAEDDVHGLHPRRTDAAGGFRMEFRSTVPCTLEFHAPGSAMPGGDLVLEDVRPGGDPLEVVVPVSRIPSATVTGGVRNPDGSVPTDVFLRLFPVLPDGSLGLVFLPPLDGKRFVIGLLPPGPYEAELGRGDGSVGIDLPRFALAAGETVDLGVFTLPEPGCVELHVTGTDGQPLAEGFFLLARAPFRYGGFEGQGVRVLGGRGTSRELAPGDHVLIPAGPGMPVLAEELEVRSGETTQVTLQMPRTVERRVRFAAEDPRILEIRWHDAGGRLLAMERSSPTLEPLRRAFVPGTYRVEVRRGGKRIPVTFVVEDRAAPEEELVLPVP